MCHSLAPEYQEDLGRPLPCLGAELRIDILALLGEDARLQAL
jgi:hypothetical protein